jgi:flagellar motor switch protein FliG
MKDERRSVEPVAHGTTDPVEDALDLGLEPSVPPRSPAAPRSDGNSKGGTPASQPLGVGGISTAPHGAGEGAGIVGREGARKAAVFILSLDEDSATQILRSLSDEELTRIMGEIPHLGVVARETVASVMREFREVEEARSLVHEGNLEKASRLLERSLAPEKAHRLTQMLAGQRDGSPFAALEDVEAETLLAFLEEEHPQTLAAILVHLSPAKSAELLRRLTPEACREVLERVAGMEGLNGEVLQRIEAVLETHLLAARFDSFEETRGLKAAAEIVRAAAQDGADLLDGVREGSPDLAEEIGRHAFVFEDLLRLDDRVIEAAVGDVDPGVAALALKDASEPVLRRVLGALPRRAAELLRREMECPGRALASDSREARRRFLDTVLRVARMSASDGPPRARAVGRIFN